MKPEMKQSCRKDSSTTWPSFPHSRALLDEGPGRVLNLNSSFQDPLERSYITFLPQKLSLKVLLLLKSRFLLQKYVISTKVVVNMPYSKFEVRRCFRSHAERTRFLRGADKNGEVRHDEGSA